MAGFPTSVSAIRWISQSILNATSCNSLRQERQRSRRRVNQKGAVFLQHPKLDVPWWKHSLSRMCVKRSETDAVYAQDSAASIAVSARCVCVSRKTVTSCIISTTRSGMCCDNINQQSQKPV